MKTKLLMVFVLAMILIAPAQASLIDDISGAASGLISAAKKLTITSYSSSVPVQIGYNQVSNYWVIQASIGWSYDQLVLIRLPSGTSDKIDGTTDTAKAQSEVAIKFNPKGSYETAPMTRQDLVFRNSITESCLNCGYGAGGGRSAAYKIETGAWQTKTVYEVAVNDQWQTVEVGMDSPADVNLQRGIFIKNLGILPNGANFPGGNWMYVFNPLSGNYELYATNDIQNAIGYWNSNFPFWGNHDWQHVWEFLRDKGKLPQKPVMTATKIDAIVVNGDYKYLKLTYPKTAQSSMIALYVPSSEANTIIIKMGGSKAIVVGTPTITTVSDKQYAELTAVIQNNGGDDYISVKPSSSYYTFTAIGDTTKFIGNGKTETFKFRAYALDVSKDCNRCAAISILADGTDPANGDSSVTIYGTIYNSDIEAATHKLSIRAMTPTGQVLSDAPLFVNGENIGKGQQFTMRPKGDYTITSANTSGYFAPTEKVVTISGQDVSADINFTETPKEDIIDLTWIFWGVLLALIGYVAYKQGFIKTPYQVVVIIAILAVLYILYSILMTLAGIAANPAMPWNWF